MSSMIFFLVALLLGRESIATVLRLRERSRGIGMDRLTVTTIPWFSVGIKST